jgi:uncharacterized DUF497 family protein
LSTAFADRFSSTFPDPGQSHIIRIVSAREATPSERTAYEEAI